MNANANNIILILGPSSSGKTSLVDFFLEKKPSFQRLGIDTALVGGKTADFMQIERENDKIIDIKITDFGLEKLKNHVEKALLSKNHIIMETIMIDEKELEIFKPIMQKAQIFFLHTEISVLKERENKRNSGLVATQKRPVGAAVVEAAKSETMYDKIKTKYKIKYIDTTNKNISEIFNEIINIKKFHP